MGIVVYNEWQKKGYPMGPSSAAYDAGLNRRLSRRCTARVKTQRASYTPSSHLGLNGGAEVFFLRPPVGRGSRRHSRPEEERGNKFRDLATPTLLHFGNAQASLALRSTSAAPIMGEVRYNSLMKTFPQEAIKRNLRRHRAQRQTALRRLQETERNVIFSNPSLEGREAFQTSKNK